MGEDKWNERTLVITTMKDSQYLIWKDLICPVNVTECEQHSGCWRCWLKTIAVTGVDLQTPDERQSFIINITQGTAWMRRGPEGEEETLKTYRVIFTRYKPWTFLLLVSINVFWLIVMLLYVLLKNISFRHYHYVHTLKRIGIETIFAY